MARGNPDDVNLNSVSDCGSNSTNTNEIDQWGTGSTIAGLQVLVGDDDEAQGGDADSRHHGGSNGAKRRNEMNEGKTRFTSFY